MQRLIIVTLLSALAITPVWAGCPDWDVDYSHTYSTTAGTVMPGRATEAWCNGGPGQPGNTQSAMSWDGATLGTEWKIWGMEIDGNGAQLTVDTVDANGNGIRSYHTNYVGGEFWLDKDGAWGNGTVDLYGPLVMAIVDITVTYINNQMVGATSNISLAGSLADCPNGCAIDYAISNALLVWSAASGDAMPANYPDLLCSAVAGEAFDICCTTMQISCVVPNESTTWGSLKSQYK